MSDARSSIPMRPLTPRSVSLEPPPRLLAPDPEMRAIPPALFLDFDGTLVEIAAYLDHVIVPEILPTLLERLEERLDGRLAVISGRSIAALDRLLCAPGIALAGSHGGEFRPAGSRRVEALADALPDTVADALSRFAVDAGGLLFERKPFSVAVHYRNRPEVRERLLARASELAAGHGLAVKHGKMVVELVMPGSDKGSAVARFMDLPGFAGAMPWFAGDDVTDEDAFQMVTSFGGSGVLVGPARQTAALWRLSDVAALYQWLEEALA